MLLSRLWRVTHYFIPSQPSSFGSLGRQRFDVLRNWARPNNVAGNSKTADVIQARELCQQ